MAPVVGIAYCLVIVRFGLRGAFRDSSPISKLSFRSPTDRSDGESIGMKSVVVDTVYHSRPPGGGDLTDVGMEILDGKDDV